MNLERNEGLRATTIGIAMTPIVILSSEYEDQVPNRDHLAERTQQGQTFQTQSMGLG